jgi:hypothetical protein
VLSKDFARIPPIKELAMKRRLALMFVSVLAVGSLQLAVAPAASAATTSSRCADPNCPWSPITDYVHRVIGEVDRICDETTEQGCPL